MKTALSFVAGVSLLALAGQALAQQPVALAEDQLDGVTAGGLTGSALALSTGYSLGNIFSLSTVVTHTESDPTGAFHAVPTAFATGNSTSLGSTATVYSNGVYFGAAIATSASSAAAALE